jgi:hypothetical protein
MLSAMAEKAKKRRHPGLRRLAVVALLVLLWISGAIGWLLRPLVLLALPRLSDDVTIFYHGRAEVADPAMGAVLDVSEPRLRKLAHDLLGWKAGLIPPGLIPQSYAFSGNVRFTLDDETEPAEVPLVVRIKPGLKAPELRVRLPSDLANESLDYDGSFTSRSKRRKYILGHYETNHRIKFDTVKLSSRLTDKELKRPVTFRRIAGEATGTVRFKVKENIGSAGITAHVRRMELRCDLEFKRYLDGISLSYKITIPKLDANITHMAPMFEGRPVEELRKLLEESMGRPRKLERLARKRFPNGIPLDVAVEIEVFKSE